MKYFYRLKVYGFFNFNMLSIFISIAFFYLYITILYITLLRITLLYITLHYIITIHYTLHYISVYPNLPRNVIARLSRPRSRDSQGQKHFLAPSVHNIF